MQAYTSYNSVDQEYKGHLRIVEEKQKAQHALESSIADTERRIEGLRKKSEESQQVSAAPACSQPCSMGNMAAASMTGTDAAC